MAFTVIRLRGTQNLNPAAKQTLHYLRLNRINHAVILPENETTKGMLQTAKDYVTWGETDAAALTEALRSRGRLTGNRPLTDEHVRTTTSFGSVEALAAAIVAGQASLKDVPEAKPLLRLHPARNGLEGIKRSVRNGGALGYRGQAINDLVRRMI